MDDIRVGLLQSKLEDARAELNHQLDWLQSAINRTRAALERGDKPSRSPIAGLGSAVDSAATRLYYAMETMEIVQLQPPTPAEPD